MIAFAFALVLATGAPALPQGDPAFLLRIESCGDGPSAPGAAIEILGRTSAPAGSQVSVSIDGLLVSASVSESADESAPGLNLWRLIWPVRLAPGEHEVIATLGNDRTVVRDSCVVVVGPETRLPSRSFAEDPTQEELPEAVSNAEDFEPFVDRWRIAPPVTRKSTGKPRPAWMDPYNSNVLKGDRPIFGKDIFLSLTGILDTLIEGRTLPSPSGVSSDQPGSYATFGRSTQLLASQSFSVTGDLFQGDTAYLPAVWRMRLTVAANLNFVQLRENGGVHPDVRRGTRRFDSQFALQELFYERKLRDLSANFDFVSVRAGIQQFSSDFRGFLFTDNTLGVRLFGNALSNRYQYNFAVFDRLEKDTNSGLNNAFRRRRQQVAVANVYRQDFVLTGYTASLSLHHLHDEPSVLYDENAFLVRPDPIGDFRPHRVSATYLGWSGFGRAGRFNVDHAFYVVTGRDSYNPIAGSDPLGGDAGPDGVQRGRDSITIAASMAAFELSYDRDWLRARIGILYGSGDDDATDRRGEGFAAIVSNPNFAGGGFSFWNRMGIALPGTGVALTHRGSLLTDLTSSKVHGQPNFVNPGVRLVTTGVDVELTPRAKVILTGNYLQFDNTAVLRAVLFQEEIARELGVDVSAGLRYRPYLSNNVVVQVGGAVFLPGRGFGDIYERRKALHQLFTNLTLVF